MTKEIQSKWISIEDKLPKSGEDVLLFNGEIIVVGYYNQMFKEFHLSYGGMSELTNTTHWMPLPELPK